MSVATTVLTSLNVTINGLLSGYRWVDTELTYSFTTSSSQYGYYVGGFQTFNSAQKTAVRLVLDAFASVAPLTFTETSAADGILRFAESKQAGTAYAYYPDIFETGGDAFFNTVDYNSVPKGSYAYQTFLHEVGHALGLDHGHDGIGKLSYSQDSLEFSVMSYRSYVGAPLTGYTVAHGSYPATLMMADIAALQYIYGADYDTNAGNTVYKWSPSSSKLTINGVSQAGSTSNKIFMTIWDGGGRDTYDFSAYTKGLKIDLNPGAWSVTTSSQLASLGDGKTARGNIANAWLYEDNKASLIENATGGSGSDSIRGNVGNNSLKGGSGNDTLRGSDGNDTLTGGSGKDKLYGGSGADRFVFDKKISSSNIDVIDDFAVRSDKIVLNKTIFTALSSGSLSDANFALKSDSDSKKARIVYNKDTGSLFYDRDGSGGKYADVKFATLDKGLSLTHGDFIIS